MPATPQPRKLFPLAPPAPERGGFLEHAGVELYYVHHLPRGLRRAKVLLAGPFGLERQTSYITWVRWARALAGDGFEVLHFDYRGQGESTGRFEETCFSDYREDLRACLRFFRGREPVPVVLAGLRLGALLAADLFAGGEGAGLLLWDPPPSGQAHLADVLRRKLASDLMEGTTGARRTREGYVAELEAGNLVEVEGFPWSARLWRDSALLPLRLPSPGERRPWKVIELERRQMGRPLLAENVLFIPAGRPPFWGHASRVIAEVSELFTQSLAFVREATGHGGGVS